MNKLFTKKFNRHMCKTVLATGVVLAMSPSYAQSQTEVDVLRAEVAELKNMLQKYVEQPKVIAPSSVAATQQIPNAKPSKALTKGGAELNIYGWVRADASYQAKGASTMYNNISAVPLEGSADEAKNSDSLRSTVSASRIGLDFKVPALGNNVGAKLEMDFFGGATRDQYRIRHAYLTYDQWLVGQTWSNFIAPEYLPETVDAATFVGGSLQRTPTIRYTAKISDQTNAVISVEDPKYSAATDPDNEMRLPALVGRINHKFANGSVVSGRSFVAEKKTSADELTSWGVGLGGKYQMSEDTMLKADYYHVKGDGRFLLWANSGYALDSNQQMQSNELDVISLGITHKFTPQLRGTLGYGYMQAKDDNQFAKIHATSATQNKNLWQGWTNIIYNPYKPISLGAEYVYGERETFDGRQGADNRFNFMALYEF